MAEFTVTIDDSKLFTGHSIANVEKLLANYPVHFQRKMVVTETENEKVVCAYEVKEGKLEEMVKASKKMHFIYDVIDGNMPLVTDKAPKLDEHGCLFYPAELFRKEKLTECLEHFGGVAMELKGNTVGKKLEFQRKRRGRKQFEAQVYLAVREGNHTFCVSLDRLGDIVKSHDRNLMQAHDKATAKARAKMNA